MCLSISPSSFDKRILEKILCSRTLLRQPLHAPAQVSAAHCRHASRNHFRKVGVSLANLEQGSHWFDIPKRWLSGTHFNNKRCGAPDVRRRACCFTPSSILRSWQTHQHLRWKMAATDACKSPSTLVGDVPPPLSLSYGGGCLAKHRSNEHIRALHYK